MKLPFFVFVSILNHLIAQASWAQALLKQYAQKVLRLSFLGITLYLQVQPDGLLKAVDQIDQPTDVEINIEKQAIQAYIQDGKHKAMRYVKISGDAEFARQLSILFERLDWDVEEDLSKIVGDGAAFQIMSFFKKARNQVHDASKGMVDALSSYWLDEQPTLVRQAALDIFSQAIHEARESVALLEKRIQRLEAQQRC